jgi:hypothetical protein
MRGACVFCDAVRMKTSIETKRGCSALAAIAALAISACASTSDGLEIGVDAEDATVTFQWKSRDEGPAILTADLGDGRRFSGADFPNHDDGKVLASLSAEDGERMRCRFRLARAASGMAGGGDGKCQLADGTTLKAAFPPAAGQNVSARY